MVEQRLRYEPETIDRSLEAFRFGLDFNDEALKEIGYREPHAHFWCFGVTEEALIDGFKILNQEGEELFPALLLEHFENTSYLEELRQCYSLVRLYGVAGLLHFDDGTIKAFPPNDMQLQYDFERRKFTSATLRERIAYDSSGYFDHKLDEAQLDNRFIFVLFKEKEKTLQGRSELESIWDIINRLYIANFMEVIVIAQSTGLKIIKTPGFHALRTDSDKSNALRPIRDMSYKLSMIMDINDVFEYHTPGNTQGISGILTDLYTALAAGTGYPLEAWRGSQQGNQSGAMQTTKKMYEVHKTIQARSVPFTKRSVKIVAEILGVALPDKFTVEWNFKEETSEREKAEVEQIEAQTDQIDAQILTGNELRIRRELPPLEFFDNQEDVPLTFLLSKMNQMTIDVQGLNENERINSEQFGEFGDEQQPEEREADQSESDERDNGPDGSANPESTNGPPDQ